MKRIICLLMCIVLVLSTCVCVGAKTVDGNGTSQSEKSKGEKVSYKVAPAENPDALARIYLCSKLNKGAVGHLFIYVENLTKDPVQVGLITLMKNQGVSMGSFGIIGSDGFGIYYNMESYRFSEWEYSTVVALSAELDQKHLDKLNFFLKNFNHWDLFLNCAFFAVGAWNSCVFNPVIFTSFPVLTRWQIQLRKHTGLTQMYTPPREDVYHVKGNGKKAKLVVCTDDALEM